jgi:TfoX/Sxy family transcriptional regulator of competence genes
MKSWKRTPSEIVAAFDKALPASPAVIRRPMFGYASAFVNGNMFAGTFQDAIVVRLAIADRDALLKIKGAAPFEPMGRPMKEYVVVPPSIAGKPKDLAAWIERAHTYARSLPPKIAASKTAASKTAAKRTATKPSARR